MNSYEMYIQLDPALEHIIEEINIYLAKDYHMVTSLQRNHGERSNIFIFRITARA